MGEKPEVEQTVRKEIRLNLIRHGKTAGNLKNRYIGTTDESLCPEGIRELENRIFGGQDLSERVFRVRDLLESIEREERYPTAELWFSSPMKRCLETAEIIRQGQAEQAGKTGKGKKTEKAEGIYSAGENHSLKNDGIRIVPEFRECDFGLFENKNYLELADCPEYQQWIDSNGTMAFPGGESPEGFKGRCCLAFEQLVDRIFQMDCGADEITVNLVVHGGTIMSIMEGYALPHREYYQWHVGNGAGYTLRIVEENWRKDRKTDRWETLFSDTIGR